MPNDIVSVLENQRRIQRIVEAAIALLETLGTEDGYFPIAGASITRELKNAVKTAGYKVKYGRRASGTDQSTKS